MPSKTKLKNAAIAARTAALPKIPKELIDQFVNRQPPVCGLQLCEDLISGEDVC